MKNALLICFLLLAGGCSNEQAREKAWELTGGDPDAGKYGIQEHGCAACHTIPGIPGATALVGPSLAGIAGRNYIGGVFENTPSNLVRWLKDPPAASPRTAMPNLALTDADARNIASYLYTLQ